MCSYPPCGGVCGLSPLARRSAAHKGPGCYYTPSGRGRGLSRLDTGSTAPKWMACVLLPILWRGPWAQRPSQRVLRTQGVVPGSYYPWRGPLSHLPSQNVHSTQGGVLGCCYPPSAEGLGSDP